MTGGDGGEVDEEKLHFSCGPTLPCIHVMNDIWKEKGIRNQASSCTKELFYIPTPNVLSVLILYILPQRLCLEATCPTTEQAHRKGFDKNPLKKFRSRLS